MKVSILTVAYNEERFIRACIRQFKDFPIEEHLVLVSEKPWHGATYPVDKTAQIAEAEGATVVTGEWPSEDTQRNYGVDWLDESDWILIVDADELYVRASIENMLSFLKIAPPEPKAYGIAKLRTYWKDTDHIIYPEESGGGIVAVRPGTTFVDKRGIDVPWGFLPKTVIMNHLSYVRTNSEMQKKLSSFEHQHEIVPGWYDNVWMKWDYGMHDLHPVNPKVFHMAKRTELPDSLKGLLDAK